MKPDQGIPDPSGRVAPNAETSGPRQVIEQAASDIAHGLKDTDLHGTPSDVPGPVTADTQQAEVPPEGVGTRTYSRRQTGGKSAGK